MIRRFAVVVAGAAAAFSLPTTARAQAMDGMNMPGMTMPMPVRKKPAVKSAPATRSMKPANQKNAFGPEAPNGAAEAVDTARPGMADTPDASMPGMDMPSKNSLAAGSGQAMPGMSMPGDKSMPDTAMPAGGARHEMAAMPGTTMPEMAMTGTALSPGNAPAPAPPMTRYADRQFPGRDMARSRSELMREQGALNFYQVMFNIAELQVRNGKGGYRWTGEASFGGDINRLWLKTEGEGAFREGIDAAEIQALYSRAVGPYFNLQGGVRHDFKPTPTRTYATLGFEGLAPYLFEVEGAAFISEKGDILARLEGYYDQRITQRLILQPRIELNLAAQDVPENRIGAGMTDAEFGLRLRYEIAREFAPYVGVSYQAKTGRTADFARADGRKATSTSFVAGIRFWF